MGMKVENLKIAKQAGSDNHYASWTFKTITMTSSSGVIKAGSLVSIKSGATYYNGVAIPTWVMGQNWYVTQVTNDRAVLGKNTNGTNNINSPIKVSYLKLVSSSASSTKKIDTLDHYEVTWRYLTANGTYFLGTSTTTTSLNDVYSTPTNAVAVNVQVKPISKTYKVNDKDAHYWTGSIASATYYISNDPPEDIATPSVEITRYSLKAAVENISDPRTDEVQFEVYNGAKRENSAHVSVKTCRASYSCSVSAGGSYRVRCRAINLIGTTRVYGGWSDFSSAISSLPNPPKEITQIRAASTTSVYLAWSQVRGATSYEIEYATELRYLGSSNQSSTISGVELTHYEVGGLESGDEYFFRVRAVNSADKSKWTDVKSVVIGKKPAAPTTWSSTTTAIVNEPLKLYWVHNSEDGSSQTYAELELVVGDTTNTYTVKNSTDEDEKDKTSEYSVDTSNYSEGVQIKWRVRTAGITKTYGDWSVQRTVDIYAPPTLQLSVTDSNDNSLETLTTFPFYVKGVTGPTTQVPVGYHVTITSNEDYSTVDYIGNNKTVSSGDTVYSQYFDTSQSLLIELSANNLDLENGVSYTVTCIASMNSGLTVESSSTFTVSWTDLTYEPNAEISVDQDSLTAYIRPYCSDADGNIVERDYMLLDSQPDDWASSYSNYYTKTDSIYTSVSGDTAPTWASNTYYAPITILLSVYRREFDGRFTELGTDIDASKNMVITDPHPALDYARYRIVAIASNTGAVSYYDMPGYPLGGKSVVIQWDEEWSDFDTTNADPLDQQPWTGSLLKLPYNIDVLEGNKSDVSFIEYIGRNHPISYYGTQVGETATWNVDIAKNDSDTIYALRRLSKWMGDVYVREPSGSGYWANISVSFNQKHTVLIVPVTLTITRVEGGI